MSWTAHSLQVLSFFLRPPFQFVTSHAPPDSGSPQESDMLLTFPSAESAKNEDNTTYIFRLIIMDLWNDRFIPNEIYVTWDAATSRIEVVVGV